MHSSDQNEQSDQLQDSKNDSLSSRLFLKLKNLQFLQLNNHFYVIIIIHTLRLLSIVHLVFSYLSNENETLALAFQDNLSSVQGQSAVYRSFQGFLYVLKVVKIVVIVLAVRGDIDSLLYKVAKRVIKYIIVISEADLLLTSLLLLLNFQENIAGFLISATVNIGINIGLDNYTNRKLESYHSSQINGFVYRLILIFLYFINSVLACIGVGLYYNIFNLILGGVVFKWYLSSGITLYCHSRPKFFMMSFISFYLTFLFLLAERIVYGTAIFDLGNIAEYILIFSCVFSFLYVYSENNKVQHKSISTLSQLAKNMKEIDLGCFDLVRAGTLDFDAEVYLSGLFKCHQDQTCSNIKCYTHNNTYYDPIIKKRFIAFDEVSKDKQSNLRFYLKCLYEQCLHTHSSRELLLDFCEFLVGEYFDLYHINRLISEIELYQLNLFDSLRLKRLKIAVNEEANSLNRLIFDGKLEIEKIMKADEVFQEVNEQINQYLTKSIEAWTSINRNEVNLTELKVNFKEIFSILDSINKSWTPLNPYLTLQKKWRFLRMSYSHYILNQKVRQKDIEGSEPTDDATINTENSYIQQGEKEEKLYNKELMFDKNALYLHTALENKSMYVLRTNQRFQEISKCSSNQIRGAELNQFLPEDVRMVHNNSVMAWLENGETNNELCYPVRFTELKTKEGEFVPVIKYFKILVNVQASKEDYLHFVCMLKINDKANLMHQEPNYCSAKNFAHPTYNFSDTIGRKSLKVESNPFLKQENLKPKMKMQELSKIKTSMRVLITILVIMTFGLYLLTSQDANNLNNYSIQYINFLNLYRYPMAFGKNMLKTMLNVGNQAKAIGQINLQIIQITALMSDPMTLQSIFNPSLNIPKMYYPFQNNSFNKGIGYNQIDLIYYMVSTIQSLNKLPANRTGEYFTNFNMYITPYDSLINSTKIRFHDSFKDIFGSMIHNQIIFLVVEISIFVLGMFYISYQVYQYFKKTKDSIKTIIDFNQKQVRKIIRYHTQLQLYLCNFSYQQPYKGISRQVSDIQLTEQALLRFKQSRKKEISLNKKSKHIYESKKEVMRTAKYIVVIAVLMSVVLTTISSFQINNMMTIYDIQSFEEDGFYFLRYFPATSVLGHAILQKYYSQVYPKQITFYPQRYIESITDLSLIARAEYIGNVLFPQSVYFQDQKNYLFGNPCTSNPSVLTDAQVSQAKCLTIYNKAFSLGITAFLRACEKQIIDFLYGRLKLTSSQVDELTSALTLVAYYITDAIMTWSSELTTMIMDFNSQNAILCVVICSILLVFHVLTCQCTLFPHLEDDFCFNRLVFEHMVPQQILIKQKVIKQKFIINGMLHQQ